MILGSVIIIIIKVTIHEHPLKLLVNNQIALAPNSIACSFNIMTISIEVLEQCVFSLVNFPCL